MTLQVGDVVLVGRACMGNPPQSRAIVVEEYDLGYGDGPSWSLLFENGAHDGFPPQDCELFDVRKIDHLPRLAGYVFTNALRLWQDWRAGVFADVWTSEVRA